MINLAKYGKPFRKKSNYGKFRKGSLIRYKYEKGRRVGTVKAKSGGNYRRRRYY